MINYKESFFKDMEFGNTENKITGGYVYKSDIKSEDFSGGYVYKDDIKNEDFGGGYVYKGDIKSEDFIGGTRKRDMIVPIGLVVNDHNDNIKRYDGEYIGVIGIDRINEFLDLNHKPLKRITRKLNRIINANGTKSNRS
jgi:hypothetical protein